ncbi:MAG: 30S ribosomal protein S17 [Bacilli bacterium]|nr:30S ribosomal protein S17 [Bacilli bacterium]
MEERKVATRRTVQGVVISNKNDKTITVLVETHRKHSKYGKRVKYRKKFYAHDENNEANVGDTVTVMETRKLSATKRWRLVSIDKKAVEIVKIADDVKEAE